MNPNFQIVFVCTRSHLARAERSATETQDVYPRQDVNILLVSNHNFSYARACNKGLRMCDIKTNRIIVGSDFAITKLPTYVEPNKLNIGYVNWMRDTPNGEELFQYVRSSLYLWPAGTNWLFDEQFDGVFWEDYDFVHNVVRLENTFANIELVATHHEHPLAIDTDQRWRNYCDANKKLFKQRFKEIHGYEHLD